MNEKSIFLKRSLQTSRREGEKNRRRARQHGVQWGHLGQLLQGVDRAEQDSTTAVEREQTCATAEIAQPSAAPEVTVISNSNSASPTQASQRLSSAPGVNLVEIIGPILMPLMLQPLIKEKKFG
ncbi:hypothetical protein glysoja_005057 [Glycine soja]|nr:hypothetical protein glysoja_005057 [Glycine soja]